ncbi:hypothetical protein HYH03_018204 [Edaphochlamys debaryana]|uniref:Alpha-galactosidase n=1 Tax=Edaphochlamys debaryana TaxID=47281 RepID=A0A835XFT3_9CHLO|nr:hypothetical protein HYH03_018204 [Edaphochlamys debaryana]|eukprot:KAG2482926.1 hypothetical protein HYH03_018204 [Edaphochlamys debaryana]
MAHGHGSPGKGYGRAIAVFGALLFARLATALNNGVGRTPAMGWNSWNYFRCNINETIIREVADAIVSSGLKDAGFVYVNIDDCWMEKRDPATGKILPFKDKFPSGMKALGDYIHSKGLKFGVYSDTGNHTCEGYPGSWGHEKIDAATYAEWGVDYLKYDYCDMNGVTESTEVTYSRMRDALAATGRPILFSLCSWGSGQPWLWGHQVGNSWRTGIDVFSVWDPAQAKAALLPSFLQPILGAVRQTQGLWEHAGPGGFNDPDMLVVGLDGMYPYGIVQECPKHVRGCKPGMYISRERWGKVGGLTQTEQRTHFAFWCIMAAPLILGNDPRAMSKATLEILLAREVLAVNQDPLGKQGRPVWTGQGEDAGLEVWAKPLADGRVALLLVNLGEVTRDVSVLFSRELPTEHAQWSREVPNTDPVCVDKHKQCKEWAEGGECKKNEGFMMDMCPFSCPDGCPHALDPPGPKATALVRDLWLEEDVGVFTGRFTAAKVEPHEARFVTLKFLDFADKDKALAALDFGPRAMAASVRARADFLQLGSAPSDAGKGGAAKAKKEAAERFVRVKELETEVQRLHNELKTREREVAALRREADEVQCTKEHGPGGGAGAEPVDGAGTVVRRSALGGSSSGGAGGCSGVWLSYLESKMSLALNLALAGMLVLMVLQPKKRHHGKSSKDTQ